VLAHLQVTASTRHAHPRRGTIGANGHRAPREDVTLLAPSPPASIPATGCGRGRDRVNDPKPGGRSGIGVGVRDPVHDTTNGRVATLP
jgi:hypothetical protein